MWVDDQGRVRVISWAEDGPGVEAVPLETFEEVTREISRTELYRLRIECGLQRAPRSKRDTSTTQENA